MSDPYGRSPRTGGRAPGHAGGLGGSHAPSLPVDLDKHQASGEHSARPAKKVAALFDLRLIIGGLFTLYGIILIITGIVDGKEELAKASGIRINLWAGIGMLITGLLFLLWMRLTEDGHDRPEHARTGSDEAAADTGANG